MHNCIFVRALKPFCIGIQMKIN